MCLQDCIVEVIGYVASFLYISALYGSEDASLYILFCVSKSSHVRLCCSDIKITVPSLFSGLRLFSISTYSLLSIALFLRVS